jgi:DNA helicase-2/ATP-dependent DNA helicase PcrA
MSQFERDFVVQHRIKLEQNYRSVGNVLKAANHLIAHNKARLGKELWTDSGEGEPLRLYESPTDLQEANWMVDEIKALIAQGHSRVDIAVLYRSNAQSRVIEQVLFAQGIPYRVYGGLRFFERAEVKHALAYLRLLENADDDTSFVRVVNFPPRGIGLRTLENVSDAAKANDSSLYRAVAHVAGKGGSLLAQFVQMIERLRFESRGLSLPEIVKLVIHSSGLITHYQKEKEGEDRVDNLEELINAAAAFVSAEGYATQASATESDAAAEMASPLAAFLSHASLEAGDNQALEGQDAVQLMSIHASKGLEFQVVFLTGLEEGLFPHENSIGSVVRGGDGSSVDGIEEERRLMYVAITRARQRLYLSFAQQRMLHGQTRYNLRSRFLDELPQDVIKLLSAPVAKATQPFWGSNEAAAFKMNKARSQWPFKIGQTVAHSKFGSGLVVNFEGKGDDLRIQVNFGRQGAKWLVVSLAKLQAA